MDLPPSYSDDFPAYYLGKKLAPLMPSNARISPSHQYKYKQPQHPLPSYSCKSFSRTKKRIKHYSFSFSGKYRFSNMPLSQSYCFISMEKSSSDAEQSSSLLFDLVDVFLFHRIFRWVNSTRSFFFRFWSQLVFGSLEICHGEHDLGLKLLSEQDSSDKKKDDGSLCREEVEMVMERLGLFCSPEGEELQEKFSSNELLGLFDEKEPSFEEVKAAFDVFDENRDGFIDARELQRVLHILGLKEGLELENCKKMIKTFDENRDGRIDFQEFVKFMENSFC